MPCVKHDVGSLSLLKTQVSLLIGVIYKQSWERFELGSPLSSETVFFQESLNYVRSTFTVVVEGYWKNNFSALGSYIQVRLISGNTSPRRLPSSRSDVG